MLVRLNRKLYRDLLVPDEAAAWIPPALSAARAFYRREPYDCVVASAPPYSVLRLGMRIAEHSQARLVADYRDPWLAERLLGSRAGLRGGLEERMERRVLARTQLALFTSASAERLYRNRYTELRASRVLYNGFKDLPDLAPIPRDAPLTWIHAGSTYSGQRSLLPVVRALYSVRDEIPGHLLLIGPEPKRELELARALGMEDRVNWVGHMELEATLQKLQHGHRLVAVVGGGTRTFDSGQALRLSVHASSHRSFGAKITRRQRNSDGASPLRPGRTRGFCGSGGAPPSRRRSPTARSQRRTLAGRRRVVPRPTA